MIVKRRKGTEIRRYFLDSGEILGAAGTVAELESLGILSHCGAGEVHSPDRWCCFEENGNVLGFVPDKEAAKLLFVKFAKKGCRVKARPLPR